MWETGSTGRDGGFEGCDDADDDDGAWLLPESVPAGDTSGWDGRELDTEEAGGASGFRAAGGGISTPSLSAPTGGTTLLFEGVVTVGS